MRTALIEPAKKWPLLLICLCGGWVISTPLLAQSVEEDLPLPRWEEEPTNLPTGSQFNSLLPSDSLTAPSDFTLSGPRLTDTPPVLMPGYSELGPTDLSLFLHGSILGNANQARTPHVPTAAVALKELPPEILRGLATSPANELLMDPQPLLGEVPRQDLERLLEFHAKEAKVRFYLLVIGPDQKLPSITALDSLAHGALTRQHSCLAVYPLGEPWRARMFMSKSVHQFVPVKNLADLAADCIADAQQVEEPTTQLQRFAVRLSTRLFWLEKTLTGTGAQTSLQEIAAEGETSTASLIEPSSTRAMAVIGLVLGGLCLLAITLVIMRMRARKKRPDDSFVWLLPDPDVLPRLGGAFSGGSGAVCSVKA